MSGSQKRCVFVFREAARSDVCEGCRHRGLLATLPGSFLLGKHATRPGSCQAGKLFAIAGAGKGSKFDPGDDDPPGGVTSAMGGENRFLAGGSRRVSHRRGATFLGGLAVTLAFFAATIWFVRESFEANVIEVTQAANVSITQAFINENWGVVRDLLPKDPAAAPAAIRASAENARIDAIVRRSAGVRTL